MASIEERVTKLLKNYAPAWDGNMQAWDATALDSLSYIELAFDLEEEFDVALPWDPDALKVPSDIVRLVSEATSQKEKPSE